MTKILNKVYFIILLLILSMECFAYPPKNKKVLISMEGVIASQRIYEERSQYWKFSAKKWSESESIEYYVNSSGSDIYIGKAYPLIVTKKNSLGKIMPLSRYNSFKVRFNVVATAVNYSQSDLVYQSITDIAPAYEDLLALSEFNRYGDDFHLCDLYFLPELDESYPTVLDYTTNYPID